VRIKEKVHKNNESIDPYQENSINKKSILTD